MHDAARRQIVGLIRTSLAPDAPLFVGHAEAAMLMGMGFKPSGPSRAFCLTAATGTATKTAPPCALPPPPTARHAPAPAPPPKLREPRPQADPAALMAEARRLADQGALADAMTPLRRFLELKPMSAEGHALAGLILASRGDRSGAIRHLRKALFLDPADEASKVGLEHLLDGRP